MSAHPETAATRIVAGVDGSPSSRAALRWAVRQAVLTGGAVEAVMAWHDTLVPGGFGGATAALISNVNDQEFTEKALAAVISDVVSPGDSVRVWARAAEGNAPQVLIDAAADADLLVVGSRGHGGFAEALLGSVSQHCVQHARCPVVIMRSDDRE